MELYSYHVFMFPFQWHFVGNEMRDKTLEQRTCLKDFVDLFKNSLWKHRPYKIDTVLNYNEYNYFYGMVRDVLFDKGELPPERALICNLTYDIPSDTHTYNFKVCEDGYKKEYKSYSLHIDSIILHLYSTGVGVLSFHLNNRLEEQSSPSDILNINQAGRRLYPPFFGIDSNLVGKQEQFDCRDFSFGLDIVQQKELAVEFSVISDRHFEDFRAYRNPENFKSSPFQVPGHIRFLFEGVPITVDKEDFKSAEKKVYLNPLLDDRMFVICWYGGIKSVENLMADTDQHCLDDKGKLIYQKSDWWYKFVFTDQQLLTCQNPGMKKELIKKHTYSRWSDFETLYGVTRYSFVCLTDSLASLKENNAAFLVNHMQTIYYKLCELCLVQRACILRFSEEVSGISAMKDNKKITLSDRIGNLYQQYMRFVNRIYFREVTAQEQGIELYNMLQDHMQIEKNVKDLDNEIKELHGYISLMQNQRLNRNTEMLTIIGALFIMPSFVLSFTGVILLPHFKVHKLYQWEAFLFLLPLFLGPTLYYLIDRRRAKQWMKWWSFFILLVFIMISIFFLLVSTNY